MNNGLKYILYLVSILFQFEASSQEVFLNDKETLGEVKNGLDLLYNFQFEEARVEFKKVEFKYPNHPVSPLLMALLVQWQNFPIELDKLHLELYKVYLLKSLGMAENILKQNSNSLEGIFFSLSARSQLARIYSGDGDFMKAAGEASKSYDYIKTGVNLKDRLKEFYFWSGLYNYYRVQYPESHAAYKPFMFFFADGDKATGLKDLEVASRETLFSNIEANFYLANILIRYESRPDLALKYTGYLIEHYSGNTFYITKHIEALLLTKNYPKAQQFLESIKSYKENFYKASYEIYSGMLEENGKKNLNEAKTLYLKGIATSKLLKKRGGTLLGFGYAGLARIAIKEGDGKTATEYYKKALEATDYEVVKKEAKNYLKKNNE